VYPELRHSSKVSATLRNEMLLGYSASTGVSWDCHPSRELGLPCKIYQRADAADIVSLLGELEA
jgi:hypothetical protein